MNKEIKEAFGFVGGDMLKGILEKELNALTSDEIDILKARRSYLTKEQILTYELDDVEEAEIEEVEEEDKLRKLSVKELKKIAKDRKIDIEGLNKKDELVEAILVPEESEEE